MRLESGLRLLAIALCLAACGSSNDKPPLSGGGGQSGSRAGAGGQSAGGTGGTAAVGGHAGGGGTGGGAAGSGGRGGATVGTAGSTGVAGGGGSAGAIGGAGGVANGGTGGVASAGTGGVAGSGGNGGLPAGGNGGAGAGGAGGGGGGGGGLSCLPDLSSGGAPGTGGVGGSPAGGGQGGGTAAGGSGGHPCACPANLAIGVTGDGAPLSLTSSDISLIDPNAMTASACLPSNPPWGERESGELNDLSEVQACAGPGAAPPCLTLKLRAATCGFESTYVDRDGHVFRGNVIASTSWRPDTELEQVVEGDYAIRLEDGRVLRGHLRVCLVARVNVA